VIFILICFQVIGMTVFQAFSMTRPEIEASPSALVARA